MLPKVIGVVITLSPESTPKAIVHNVMRQFHLKLQQHISHPHILQNHPQIV
jgi:hypothetical protein